MKTHEQPDVYLFFDLGSKCGYAVGAKKKLIDHGTIDLALRAKQLRCTKTTALYQAAREIVKEHGVTKVCRENSLMSFKQARNDEDPNDPKKAARLNMNDAIASHAAMGAIIDLVADLHKLEQLKPVAPISIKKWATGSGKAKKPQVMRAAEMEFGVKAGDDNEADACYGCSYAMHHDKPIGLPF